MSHQLSAPAFPGCTSRTALLLPQYPLEGSASLPVPWLSVLGPVLPSQINLCSSVGYVFYWSLWQLWGFQSWPRKRQDHEMMVSTTSSTEWHLDRIAWEKSLQQENFSETAAWGHWPENKEDKRSSEGSNTWRGFMCLDDAVQHLGGESLGQIALKSSRSLGFYSHRVCLIYGW